MKDKKNFVCLGIFLAIAFLLFGSCDWDDTTGGGLNGSSISVTVSPSVITMAKGTNQQFSAKVSNDSTSGITWSVAGNLANGTTISREGLLSVAANESSRTLTVKADWSSWSDKASGTATVTVATDADIPSNLELTPGKTGISLSWGAVNGAANYKVYRSSNGKDYSSPLGTTDSASYTDTAIAAGVSYYYAVSAMVNGLETGKSVPAFGFAEEYFALPVQTAKRLVPITGGQKQYYRFPVSAGGSYTIVWEDGNSHDLDYYSSVRCGAWQNDGTEIFTNAYNGYTSLQAFTATVAGYVTVEVKNNSSSTRCNYMAYCYMTNGNSDTGVVALPPAPVTGIKVTNPAASSITLGWDAVQDAVRYNVYRAPSQEAAPGLLPPPSYSTEFTDSNVAPGIKYYYIVAPVNAEGREGVQVQGAFAYAAAHFTLPAYSGSYTLNLPAKGKHYYRLAVTAGQSYTITWDDGSNADLDYYSYVRCGAWQNDGTEIFANAYSGRSSPKPFTATAAGYVTVEIQNTSSSTSCDYRIYYH